MEEDLLICISTCFWTINGKSFMHHPHHLDSGRSGSLPTLFVILFSAWTFIVGSLTALDILQIRQTQRGMARNEARSSFNKDQSFRFWAARHGGIYVPITERTPPSPFLSHIPERDIETPGGKFLTLMNPAYMLRQMMEEHSDLYGVRGHITSLKPLRPETVSDEWERSALLAFERGEEEIFEFTNIDGNPYLRLMRPMFVKKECLGCHAHQGYKEGDIRGGVSISVSMEQYLSNQRKEITLHSISLAALWMLGAIGLGFAGRTSMARMKERDDAETKLQEAHDQLELRVVERTSELKDANENLKREIGERKQAEAELTKHREHLEELVEERTAELLRVNEQLTREIDERKRVGEELEVYASRLERSNRELEDFAFVASHDLQEPLRKIQAFGGMIRDKCSGALDDAGRDYLDRMTNATKRMGDFIQDLLEYSRVTTRPEPFTPVDLNGLAQEVVDDLDVYREKVNGTIEIGKLDTIGADARQMRQLFQNLISNGLKFHGKEERPVVRIHGRVMEHTNDGPDGWCRIFVEDNGIGFDEKYVDRIFAPFQRLHGRSEYEGTGIGLAICKKIVERHGGTITAKSIPGKGSTFIVTLPPRLKSQGKSDQPADLS